MADIEKKEEAKSLESFKPVKVRAKVKGHFARGSVTVSADKFGEFNAVTSFDNDPPNVGDEIEVEVKSVAPQIVDGKAISVVEHAVHLRPAKK
jgi:hypothetical protein